MLASATKQPLVKHFYGKMLFLQQISTTKITAYIFLTLKLVHKQSYFLVQKQKSQQWRVKSCQNWSGQKSNTTSIKDVKHSTKPVTLTCDTYISRIMYISYRFFINTACMLLEHYNSWTSIVMFNLLKMVSNIRVSWFLDRLKQILKIYTEIIDCMYIKCYIIDET